MKSKLDLQSTTLGYDRIYVNSFTQRVIGNDVSYTVDLGRPFTINHSIQLDLCVMENLFSNFYQSQEGDYRDLSFSVGGVLYKVFVDQYLSSLTDVISFLNANTSFTWVSVPVERSYTQTIGLAVQLLGVAQNWTTKGFGWTKLGFKQNITGTQIFGSNFMDLSLPSAIIISIDNIPQVISSGKGSASFVIPNNSQFGGKIIYTNTVESTCQTIYIQNPVTVSQLNIQIQGCDQREINTIKANNSSINQTGSEHIFLFTIK